MIKNIMLFFVVGLIVACGEKEEIDHAFTIAVIPDTQNLVDYTHQNTENYPIDSAAMFIEHMQYIAGNTEARGGEIAFVTSVGDVWQTRHNGIDPAHRERGLKPLNDTVRRVAEIESFEVPLARRGYDILAATGTPFSVVPGNHDYDWLWRDSRYPIQRDRFAETRDEWGQIVNFDTSILGILHVGGFGNFNSVFGANGDYFRDKSWYVDHFNGGANSAQIFEKGGYRFLHLGFEMQPGDAVLEWARGVTARYPDLPTIISTHDFLDNDGSRTVRPIADYTTVDPDEHNRNEDVWQKFISKNDQIFLVLSGHNRGQNRRMDHNDFGHDVHQILADYQDRGRAITQEEGTRQKALSDGWLRLMNFDMSGDVPKIHVRTYSTYYKKYSTDIADYANWYKKWEHPELTDEEFNAMDDFTIELDDFRERFGER